MGARRASRRQWSRASLASGRTTVASRRNKSRRPILRIRRGKPAEEIRARDRAHGRPTCGIVVPRQCSAAHRPPCTGTRVRPAPLRPPPPIVPIPREPLAQRASQPTSEPTAATRSASYASPQSHARAYHRRDHRNGCRSPLMCVSMP